MRDKNLIKEFIISESDFPENYTYAIYGVNEIATIYYEIICDVYKDDVVDFFIDSSVQGPEEFCNHTVKMIDESCKDCKDNRIYIVAAFHDDQDRMRENLIKNGVDKSRILPLIEYFRDDYILKYLEKSKNIYFFEPFEDVEEISQWITETRYYLDYDNIDLQFNYTCENTLYNKIDDRNVVIKKFEVPICADDIIFIRNIKNIQKVRSLCKNPIICIDDDFNKHTKMYVYTYISNHFSNLEQYKINYQNNFYSLQKIIRSKRGILLCGNGASLEDGIKENIALTEQLFPIVCNNLYQNETVINLIQPNCYLLSDQAFFRYETRGMLQNIVNYINQSKCYFLFPKKWEKLIVEKLKVNKDRIIALEFVRDQIAIPSAENLICCPAGTVILTMGVPLGMACNSDVYFIGCDGKKAGKIEWEYQKGLENDYSKISKYKGSFIGSGNKSRDNLILKLEKAYEKLLQEVERRGNTYYTLTHSYFEILEKKYIKDTGGGYEQKKSPFSSYVEKLLVDINYSTKKIFCFGEWSIMNSLLDEFENICHIEKILDNNPTIQGSFLKGKEIVDPKYLISERKGEFIVLIVSNYVEDISKQLDTLGLEAGTDYFDLYSPLKSYSRVKMFVDSISSFEKFIENIEYDYFRNIPITKEKTIGVVCICEMNRYLTVYSLTLGLLLRSYGYKVSLIIDTLEAFEGYHYFEGIENIALKYVDKILPQIKYKCPDIEILYIDQEGTADIDVEDKKYAAKMAKYILQWFGARYDKGLFEQCNNQEEKAQKILLYTLTYIKKFYQIHKFDTLNLYTGLHRHRCMHYYSAKKNGMEVYTYDDGGRGKMLYSEGVAIHSKDITKMFQNQFFDDVEKNKIIELAKKEFFIQKNSTVKDERFSCQTIQYTSNSIPEKIYDIIIPLNLAWDAAALDRDDLFNSDIDWLNSTLKFILDNTDANVMIREHPIQNKINYYHYIDIKKYLSYLKGYEDRIYFAAASDKINTYQYIEHCKLVLPYTSTVGLEAVMMGKNIILHTNVYYDNIGIAYKASSKEDYYQSILYYLKHPDEKICADEKIAYLCFYYSMHRSITSEFCIHHTDWLSYSMDELRELSGVPSVIDIIGEGIPSVYTIAKENLKLKS